MGIGAILGIVFGSITALGVLFAGARWVVKTVKDTSFDSGKHAANHETIGIDIGEAHRRIDVVEKDVAELSSTTEAHEAIHRVILSNQDHANSRLDKIYDILIARE